MKSPATTQTRSAIPLKTLQRAVSDPTRWRILDLLQQRGAMTTELITKAVRGSVQNVSKHLVFLRNAGLLEHRMGRLYAIPDEFLVPGERMVDFGAIILRLDRNDAKH